MHGLITSDRHKEIIRAIAPINTIFPYKMDQDEMIMWAKDIDDLAPDTEPEKLMFLVKCFKTDEIVWDSKLGIQNVLRGLKRIVKTEAGYQVLRPIW